MLNLYLFYTKFYSYSFDFYAYTVDFLNYDKNDFSATLNTFFRVLIGPIFLGSWIYSVFFMLFMVLGSWMAIPNSLKSSSYILLISNFWMTSNFPIALG